MLEGLRGVPAEVRDAARGMGMTDRQVAVARRAAARAAGDRCRPADRHRDRDQPRDGRGLRHRRGARRTDLPCASSPTSSRPSSSPPARSPSRWRCSPTLLLVAVQRLLTPWATARRSSAHEHLRRRVRLHRRQRRADPRQGAGAPRPQRGGDRRRTGDRDPARCLAGSPHRGSFVAINVSNIGRALPSLAIIAIGIALLGLGFLNMMIALVVLAVPPMLTNAYTAVDAGRPRRRRCGPGDGHDAARSPAPRRAAARAAADLRRHPHRGRLRRRRPPRSPRSPAAGGSGTSSSTRPVTGPPASSPARCASPRWRSSSSWPSPRQRHTPPAHDQRGPSRSRGLRPSTRQGDDTYPMRGSGPCAAGVASSPRPSPRRIDRRGVRQRRRRAVLGQPGAGKPAVTIGAKNFTEQYILGELYAQALQAEGLHRHPEVQHRQLGDRRQGAHQWRDRHVPRVHGHDPSRPSPPRRSGRRATRRPTTAAQRFESARGFTLLERDAVLRRRRPGRQAGATRSRVSRPSQTSRSSASAQLRRRRRRTRRASRALVGLKQVYGLDDLTFKPLSIGLQYKALATGKIDVADIFTTDAQLQGGRYTRARRTRRAVRLPERRAGRLQEDRWPTQGPAFAETLNAVSATLTNEAMQKMNAAVDLDKRKPAAVAKKFLEANDLV